MKTVKLLVLVCFALLVALPLGSIRAQTPPQNTYGILTSTPQADGSIYHIVQPGESLWVISNAYGIPGSEIMVLNGNSPEAEEVYIGQVLLIRRANTPTPTPTQPPSTTQILFGDSQKVGLTMAAISIVGLALVITFGFLKKPR